jgi:SAM-dependent methyltransferase/glycosyltransferase involved in cell wall biosynthesis
VSRNRIAFFRPSPHVPTAATDYAEALIPELEKLVDLQIFDAAPKRFDPDEFAAVVYLIGNTSADLWIYESALRYPGIVVLDEPDLHNVVRELTKNEPAAYFREVLYEIFGQEWDAGRDTELDITGQQPRTFSMLRRLLDRSRACIVNSRYMEGAVRMKGFRGKIARVPRGTFVRNLDGAGFRERLAIEKGQPLIGVFGSLWTDEELCEFLGVFRVLVDHIPDVRMLIATTGGQGSTVRDKIAELGVDSKVHLPNVQSPTEVDGFIAACDVVLNVQSPLSSEASAMSARAFGLGKTAVVADHGIAKEWPDDTCVKIPDGRYRDRVLFESLKWLLSNPQITAGIGSSAAQWASENCTWAYTARIFADFLTSHSDPVEDVSLNDDALRIYLRRWADPGTDRESYLNGHESRLIRILQLTPAGTASDRILELGCFLQLTPALRNILGYGRVRGSYLGAGGGDLKLVNACDGEFFECGIDLFDCERDRFPYPDGYFATVLCCELLEHLKHDPMWMMSEINRILKPGGTLVLTTPNVVSLRAVRAVLMGIHPGFYNRYPDPQTDRASNSKHEREYAPGEILKLLSAAGFAVDHVETSPYSTHSDPELAASLKWVVSVLDSQKQPLNLRDDCIFALGRKESLPKDLRPFWLYDSAASDTEPR